MELLQTYSGTFEGFGIFDFLTCLQELWVDQNEVIGQTFPEAQWLSCQREKPRKEQNKVWRSILTEMIQRISWVTEFLDNPLAQPLKMLLKQTSGQSLFKANKKNAPKRSPHVHTIWHSKHNFQNTNLKFKVSFCWFVLLFIWIKSFQKDTPLSILVTRAFSQIAKLFSNVPK